MVMDAIVEKARRRIKRFIKTGEHQARVHQVDDKTYEYKEKHHVRSLFFKRDILGRLRKITP
jgi:hypothetical protein